MLTSTISLDNKINLKFDSCQIDFHIWRLMRQPSKVYKWKESITFQIESIFQWIFCCCCCLLSIEQSFCCIIHVGIVDFCIRSIKSWIFFHKIIFNNPDVSSYDALFIDGPLHQIVFDLSLILSLVLHVDWLVHHWFHWIWFMLNQTFIPKWIVQKEFYFL